VTVLRFLVGVKGTKGQVWGKKILMYEIGTQGE